jgi:glycosyltransferase involved in cell wall biosynthesis
LRVAVLITRLEGGAGILALRGAMALDPRSYQLTIITGQGSSRLLSEARAAGLMVVDEPALRAPIDPVGDVVALRRLAVLLARERFDVVHTHTAKAGTLGRLAARRAAVPRIVHTYHGFPFHEFQPAVRRAAYIAIERRLGRFTDLALCVGTGVAVEAVRRGLISPERIRTIGVAVDGFGWPAGQHAGSAVPVASQPSAQETAAGERLLGEPPAVVTAAAKLAGAGLAGAGLAGAGLAGAGPAGAGAGAGPAGAGAGAGAGPAGAGLAAREIARRELGLPSDATVIGAVGRLTYQKAPEDFVDMIRRLRRPGVVGVWVGDGELAGQVRRLAAAEPAAPVVLAGERADVPRLLPAFDVFALPSRYEGLPTAIVEAMMCGVPVVATAVNAVADVVVPGETGLLVPPRRPDLMAGAVSYLLSSPAAAARMATRAQAQLGDRYGISALRASLAAAYARPA